jgi:hypothetical protein
VSLASSDSAQPYSSTMLRVFAKGRSRLWEASAVSHQDARLSDDEWKQLMRLLGRYANSEMDQFDHWRFPTNFGQLFVDLRMLPSPGVNESTYVDMSEWSTGQ